MPQLAAGAGRQRHLPHGRRAAGPRALRRATARRRSDPLLGPPTLSVGRHRGRHQRQHRAGPLPHRDRPALVPGEDPPTAAGAVRWRTCASSAGIDFPLRVCAAVDEHARPEPARLGGMVDALGRGHRRGARQPPGAWRVPYGTDASTLAEAGIPSVVFGPGDIAQAHTCDEWGRSPRSAGRRGPFPVHRGVSRLIQSL